MNIVIFLPVQAINPSIPKTLEKISKYLFELEGAHKFHISYHDNHLHVMGAPIKLRDEIILNLTVLLKEEE